MQSSSRDIFEWQPQTIRHQSDQAASEAGYAVEVGSAMDILSGKGNWRQAVPRQVWMVGGVGAAMVVVALVLTMIVWRPGAGSADLSPTQATSRAPQAAEGTGFLSFLFGPSPATEQPGQTQPDPTQSSPVPSQNLGSGGTTSPTAKPTSLPTPGLTISPLPSAKPSATATPAPTPVSNGLPYVKNALVIKYFPLTADGKYIDKNISGDVGETYQEIRQRTIDQTTRLVARIGQASTYLGYKNSSASPSLKVNVIKTFEYTKAFPYTGVAPNRIFDYRTILNQHNICGYVQSNNVSEVFIWAYSGHGSPGGDIRAWESNMSGPYGDISNSYQEDDMPKCSKTYVTYVLNYGRGTAEALHSWGHQIEREMNTVEPALFKAFQGPDFAGLGKSGVAHCGSVHHPPNSTADYDYANKTSYASDCLNLKPGSIGTITQINCMLWGCDGTTDTNNPQLNYMTWNWQHLFGYNNGLTYQGKAVPNMWQIHADFDAAMAKAGKTRQY